jgi:hypothetical protein
MRVRTNTGTVLMKVSSLKTTLIKKKEAPSQCGENEPEALYAPNSVNG